MRLLIAMTDRALSLKGEGIRFIFTVRSTLGGYWSDIFYIFILRRMMRFYC